MLKLKRTAMITVLLCLFAFYVNAEMPKSKKVANTKAAVKGKALEPWEAWDKFRPQMLTISRQLGVTCIYCHDSKNYRDASKPTHQIAKAHMEMVDMINEKFKNSFSDKIDCYSCHKGVARPEFKEKKAKF